jgi:hypothetical protein
MKKTLSYICMLLFFTATATVAQNTQPDAMRSAAEQVAYEKSIPVNPSKCPPETQVDSRMDPAQTQTGPVNWKPGEVAVEERKSPEGAQPQANSINYRKMIGSKTQPEAPKPGNETNYRNLKCTPTQPACEKPQK